MIKFDVCWEGDNIGGHDVRRVKDVQMIELPRRGDWIDLEYLPDKMFAGAFKGEEPHDVHCLLVQKVVHRPETTALIISELPFIEVWVTAPGVQLCSRCGHEV